MATTPVIRSGSICSRDELRQKIRERMQEYERLNYPEIIKLQRREIRQLERELECLQRRLKQR